MITARMLLAFNLVQFKLYLEIKENTPAIDMKIIQMLKQYSSISNFFINLLMIANSISELKTTN